MHDSHRSKRPPQVLPATHQAFGLFWHFSFPFSAFSPAPDSVNADVVVDLASLPPIPADPANQNRRSRFNPAEVNFELDDVGRFHISGGDRILVDPHAGGDSEMMKLILMGAASAMLLHQRGWLPLHGSGIATPFGAALFVGHSGAGKSSTLAAFVNRGFAMICDDLASIRFDSDNKPRVFPGVPLYKLWADSAQALRVKTEALSRVREQLEKFMVPAANRQTAETLPVHTIYQIEIHDQPTLSIVEEHNAAKFNVLLDHTWQNLTLRRMGLQGVNFQQLVNLANHVRVVTVRRPRQAPELGIDQLAACVEADLLAQH